MLINVPKALDKLPPGIPVVLCQGARDEFSAEYETDRNRLEALVKTGGHVSGLLFFTTDSPGAFSLPPSQSRFPDEEESMRPTLLLGRWQQW